MDSSPRDLAYRMIGMIANSWAMIEYCVDIINTIIFFRHDARSYEKRIPVALESKLKFLRRACNRIPKLKADGAAILPLVEDVLALRRHRHVVIHGVATGFDTGTVTYNFIKNENDNILLGQATLTLQALYDLVEESTQLARRANEIEDRFRVAWVEDGSKPFSELTPGE